MNRISRRTLAVLVAAALAACSSQDDHTSSQGVSPSGVEGTSTEETYEAPVLAAISAALGAELTDIYKAVLAARRPYVADCVKNSGWTISSTDLDALFDPGDAQTGTMTAYIDKTIADFGTTSVPVPVADPLDGRRNEKIVSCMNQAEAQFPNPNMMVLAAIEDFDRAVSARVAADPRVTQAKSVRDECAAHEGVPAIADAEPMTVLQRRITEIQEAVADGSKAIDEATTDLQNLKVIVLAVEGCYAKYHLALNAVVDEIQQAELKARPELVPSIAEQTRDLMDQYRALLPDHGT